MALFWDFHIFDDHGSSLFILQLKPLLKLSVVYHSEFTDPVNGLDVLHVNVVAILLTLIEIYFLNVIVLFLDGFDYWNSRQR